MQVLDPEDLRLTNDPIHTKAVPDEIPSVTPLAAEPPPVDLPKPADAKDPAPPLPAESGTDDPQSLGPILDDALDRMGRRAVGTERPIPLPWSNLSAALGGGLWGGTCVTLVGDTGSGKTQWALQVAVHAAEAGVPVCYVAPESTVDQIAARVLALKGGQRWSDLYVGRSGKDVLDSLRESHAAALKRLPFHIVAGVGTRSSPPSSSIRIDVHDAVAKPEAASVGAGRSAAQHSSASHAA
jgi:hypothetical protein